MANAINSLNYGNNVYTFTLPYGSCSTAAGTASKAVTVDNFSLETGARVAVKFTVTNTASSPTLNVNGTGAKAIYYKGGAITAGYLAANKVYEFIYNGTQWDLIGDVDTDTTYGVATSSALGLVKSGTDITVDSSGNVSVNDDSHNHVISNIDNLQSSLDAKVPTSRTVNGKTLSSNITLSASDVGATTVKKVTQAEYDALPSSKLTDGIIYTITDSDDLSAINMAYDGSVTGLGANVQTAIDNCFQSVSSGKKLVASAITDKGVTTASDADFMTMANNIRSIETSSTSMIGSMEQVHAAKGSNQSWTSTYTATKSGIYLAICFSAGNTSSNTTSITTTGGVIFTTSVRPEDSGQTHITVMYVELGVGDTVTGKEPNATTSGRAAFVVWEIQETTVVDKYYSYTAMVEINGSGTTTHTQKVVFDKIFVEPPAVAVDFAYNQGYYWSNPQATNITTSGCDISAYVTNATESKKCKINYTVSGYIP